MTITNRLKDHLERKAPIYLGAWMVYAISTTAVALIGNMKEQSRLGHTADIVCRGYPSLYGFDEDGNGSIDRIENVGIIPYKGMNFPIHQTFRNDGGRDWNFEHSRLVAFGKKRK